MSTRNEQILAEAIARLTYEVQAAAAWIPGGQALHVHTRCEQIREAVEPIFVPPTDQSR